MNWLERLNAQTAPSQCGARVLRWNYNPNLSDNMPHRHTFYEVCLVGSRGHALWSVGESATEIKSGDLILARPGAIHQISRARELELFWVTFSLENAAPNHIKPNAEIAGLWRAFEVSDRNVARQNEALSSLWLALKNVASGEEIAGKSAQIEALQSAVLLSIAQIGAGSAAPLGIAPLKRRARGREAGRALFARQSEPQNRHRRSRGARSFVAAPVSARFRAFHRSFARPLSRNRAP